ncbi:MAG: hypothetical protein OEV86_15950 [Candidatus Krumholzibacteria bacterium]|nr:hypothetical protein [Candidatus Krumholzibacteria bacterium]
METLSEEHAKELLKYCILNNFFNLDLMAKNMAEASKIDNNKNPDYVYWLAKNEITNRFIGWAQYHLSPSDLEGSMKQEDSE